MPRSRCSSILPRATWLLNAATRLARACQALNRGARINWSAAKSATTVTLKITSSFWRFLISTFSSFRPREAEAELQRWSLAPSRTQVGIADLRHRAQLLQSLHEDLVIA